jgi:polysaccharide chain length determinant protein (PEP-CTERM system associated)
MLGHRTLNVEDYLFILKRRWWILAIPAIIFPIIAIGITFMIPPKYQSQTLVLINQQKVPEDFVKTLVTEDLDSRLASMKEQILSRSSLQPIIEKYNLYADKHTTMDQRIDLVRKDILIDPIRSEIAHSNGLPGFKIFFTASDPQTAQQVCAEITALFTGANLRIRQAAVEGTTNFLKEQLDEAKHNLDDQDAKLAAFQRQYFGMLPGDETNNVNLLTTLNSQLDATTQSIQNLEQNKAVMEAMLSQQAAQQPTQSVSGANTQTPFAQQKELDDLEAQEAQLSALYTDNYPDLKDVRRKIADLRKQMAKAASAPPVAPSSTAVAPSRSDSASVQQLRAQIHGYDLAIQAKHKQQDQLEQQIRTYQARIQSSPQVEEQQKELTRDYQTSQEAYDHLLSEMNQSQMATDLELRQGGETFSLLDAANLPDTPTFPKPGIFALGGLAAGLGIGLVFIAFLEYRDTALRSERDVWAFTELPTLAVIAWSGEMMERDKKLGRLKRLFGRKGPDNLIADAPGSHV